MRKLTLFNPWTITGLTDGDGSFYIAISKSAKIGSVSINLQIMASINIANMQMLELVKSFFGPRVIFLKLFKIKL